MGRPGCDELTAGRSWCEVLPGKGQVVICVCPWAEWVSVHRGSGVSTHSDRDEHKTLSLSLLRESAPLLPMGHACCRPSHWLPEIVSPQSVAAIFEWAVQSCGAIWLLGAWGCRNKPQNLRTEAFSCLHVLPFLPVSASQGICMAALCHCPWAHPPDLADSGDPHGSTGWVFAGKELESDIRGL